ncbi:MAG TPA: 4-(cytidine 5'-diphospho)-2-C-methyl-D-erythritol kinase [Terriglobales bacterium]|nr:4-(cytidine 5'-diphospho)-2-C-methyl-D-erythritol kinase [Terriglobales bacterium]
MSSATRFRALAYAKINLGLKIIGCRSDGFHELRTIFQTISLADTLEVTVSAGQGITLQVHGEAPSGEENLAYRAAALFLRELNIRRKIAITLTKRIPSGAGLGGGSSDAAAVLRALAMASRVPTSSLLPLAARLGADVPAFLIGGTVLGLGRGDEVYPLADLARWHCVIAQPNATAIFTPQAFSAWDRAHPVPLTPGANHATLMKFCSLLQQVLPAFRTLPSSARNREAGPTASRVHAGIENDFQPEVFSHSPDFSRIHQSLRRAGAVWVSLTGSGAAQFGLFPQADVAAATAARLGARDRSWHCRFVSRAACDRGVVRLA